MPTRRHQMPVDYFHWMKQFGHGIPGGPRAGLKLQWPTNGSARLLRAALAQHCIVVAAMDAIRRHPRNPSIPTIAAGGRVDLSHLRMALQGQTKMQMAEVATLASVAPDALPDPEWVHHTLERGTLTFRRQIARTGRGVAGAIGLMSADEIVTQATMAALAGWVGVEADAEEDAADDRLAEAAHPLLERSALDQARAAGLPGATTGERNDGIVIRAAHAYAPATIDGCYDPAGPILAAHLPGNWIETVYDAGWAVIDGHFIAEIFTSSRGRPQTVRAVRLAPERPEDPESEWLYSADRATVDSSQDRPIVTFSQPPSAR